MKQEFNFVFVAPSRCLIAPVKVGSSYGALRHPATSLCPYPTCLHPLMTCRSCIVHRWLLMEFISDDVYKRRMLNYEKKTNEI